MKVAVATIAYREARLLPKFLEHIPDWVDTTLVLVSKKSYSGAELPDDGTEQIAKEMGADVITYHWTSETDQRNAGQEYLSDCDWIVWLDPDEFLDRDGWNCLKQVISDEKAFVVMQQRVFWKHKEVSPHTDYQQMIMCKPDVRFVDRRVVDSAYGTLPITLYHFSWARTDEEILQKIQHYSHAGEFDAEAWYKDVWLADKTEDLHPKTPETLKALIDPVLPKELEALNLWPDTIQENKQEPNND